MTQYGLTAKQRRVFNFIKAACKTGVAPSFREISDELGINGVSNVKRQLDILQDKGYITRMPRRARSIVICKGAE